MGFNNLVKRVRHLRVQFIMWSDKQPNKPPDLPGYSNKIHELISSVIIVDEKFIFISNLVTDMFIQITNNINMINHILSNSVQSAGESTITRLWAPPFWWKTHIVCCRNL